VQPKVFIAENVAGLVSGVVKGYFISILKGMKSCGYVVSARVLDAQWLGVPQRRKRIIFVGVRADLGIAPVHPKPLPYRYSIREAVSHIKSISCSPHGYPKNTELDVDAPAPTLMASPSSGAYYDHSVERELPLIWKYAIGKEWDSIGEGAQSSKYINLFRPHMDDVCPTITQTAGCLSAASVTHPTERRKFTVEELKALSSFPADFVLSGNYGERVERLGRAVPPIMMCAIAKTVRDEILNKCVG